MRYHNITKGDMLNGVGLRTVLWVAGCEHHCKGCHNPETWSRESGIVFGEEDLEELLNSCSSKYIAGLTLSGGDPLMEYNLPVILNICRKFRELYPEKTIWVYSGRLLADISESSMGMELLKLIDVLVDGKFVKELADVDYKWAGSTNQRVIDVQRSLRVNDIVRYREKGDYYNDPIWITKCNNEETLNRTKKMNLELIGEQLDD